MRANAKSSEISTAALVPTHKYLQSLQVGCREPYTVMDLRCVATVAALVRLRVHEAAEHAAPVGLRGCHHPDDARCYHLND